MTEQVDLILVHDYRLAEQIVAALKHAGVQHVDVWPEDMLRTYSASSKALLTSQGWFRAKRVPVEQVGPFHIRVPGEWYHDAHVALMKSGLTASD
jgi:hypothetical protein